MPRTPNEMTQIISVYGDHAKKTLDILAETVEKLEEERLDVRTKVERIQQIHATGKQD